MIEQCAAGQDILLNFPEYYPVVSADEDRIRQVLINLVSNAVKYASQGNITISGSYTTTFANVSVIDEGPGLSPEDLVHVFDRFYRSKRTANSVKGTGLGLFLSKAIVEAHGGNLRVDNRTDRNGAVFTLSLPISSPVNGKSQVIDLHG